MTNTSAEAVETLVDRVANYDPHSETYQAPVRADTIATLLALAAERDALSARVEELEKERTKLASEIMECENEVYLASVSVDMLVERLNHTVSNARKFGVHDGLSMAIGSRWTATLDRCGSEIEVVSVSDIEALKEAEE